MVLVRDSAAALERPGGRVPRRTRPRSLTVAGVTGTDGKTTTATMLWAAWRAAGLHSGLISTVDFRDGDTVVANTTRVTTLEAVETQRRLAELRDAGCTHVVLETSSHGLEMHRVDDVDYRLAVYTRITSEHLDVHGDRERYFAAKARLLEMVGRRSDGVAVLDRDDDFAYPRLAAMPVATRLTYSVAGARRRPGRRGRRRRARTGSPSGAHAVGQRRACSCSWPGASTPATRWRRSPPRAAAAPPSTPPSPASPRWSACTGAWSASTLGQPFSVVIDYAHTADSLEKVLTELRAATAGRLWVVFGSAGERDVDKRAAMGEVAARLADVVVVTDEDPRGEDRVAICEQIAGGAERAGARRGDTLHVIPDRAEAIAFALRGAAPGDTVLCAGKGHESSIITASGSGAVGRARASSRRSSARGRGPDPDWPAGRGGGTGTRPRRARA